MMESALPYWRRHLMTGHQTNTQRLRLRCFLFRSASTKGAARILQIQFTVRLQHSGIICMLARNYAQPWFTDLKTRDGGHYAGAYTYDEATGEIKGCPARASNVKAVIQSIKTREKSKGSGATRNHAEAMSLEELQHLMKWSTEECPDEWLTGDNWRSEVQDSVEALKHCLQHGFMRGFMSSGFTLWTRSVVISHLLQLKCTGLNPQVFWVAESSSSRPSRKLSWSSAVLYSTL